MITWVPHPLSRRYRVVRDSRAALKPAWLSVLTLALITGLVAAPRDAAAEASGLPDIGIYLPRDLGLWKEGSFRVGRIELRGNTVLSADAVRAIVEPYEQSDMTTRQLQALREALSRAYIDAGYVSSGVIIPDQEIAGGDIYLEAVEGTFAGIEVRTDGRLTDRYIAHRLARPESIVNIGELQAAIQLLQQDPRVERVAAELVPSSESGRSLLRAEVTESRAWYTDFRVDNYRSESVGAERARLSLGHLNLTGHGDHVALHIGESRGSDNHGIRYNLPFSRRLLSLDLYYDRSDASVLEEPFNALDVRSETETIGLGLNWPLVRTLAESLALGLALETRESTTELLGLPFSLSPGALDGVSKVAVAALSLDWSRKSERQVMAARVTVRQGFLALDATDAKDNPLAVLPADGDFRTWMLQAQYLRRLGERTRLGLRLTCQRANEALLSVEKLAVGGSSTVRGYRENFLVRDNGLIFNIELPIDLGAVTLMPFIDYGQSWDEQDTAPTSLVRNTDEKRYIISAGLDLNWEIVKGLQLHLTWADALADNFSAGEDPRDSVGDRGLQDRGWHFSLSYRFGF